MLSHALVSTLALLSISSGCMAKPILWRPAQTKRTNDQSKSSVSFNNYQGLSSMSQFDNFNGQSNFDGSSNTVIIKQEEVRVCHSVQVEVLQQQLTVIREYVKRLVTEQVCETETQTIIVEQFSSGIDSFSGDLRRQNGKSPSYDSNIASMIHKVMPNDNGDIDSSNLGFNGSSVGSNSVKVQDNWNDATSPNSTAMAYAMAQQAAGKSNDSSDSNSSSSDSSSSSSAQASSTSSSASASASGK